MGPKAQKTEKKTVTKEKKSGGRAPTPYILFCQDKRPEIKAANPNAAFGDLGKLLGKAWSALDDKGKAPWVKKSADMKK